MGKKKFDKRKAHYDRYKNGNVRFRNKLKRIRQSNGEAEAERYAKQHKMSG